jgi:putative sugar O-methyltransferase
VPQTATHERFDALAERFADRWRAVEPLVEPAFVREDWAERNSQLARSLLPVPPRDFLAHPVIRFQMFVDGRYVEHELPYVRDRLPSAGLLAEDTVGGPPLTHIRDGPPTSSNTVHHLHHLLRFEEATGRRLSDAGTIVEWGAGYGNLAKLVRRLHGGAPTIVALDTPIFSALQWLYLSAVLGEEHVVLHAAPGQCVAGGRINVVPIGLVHELDVRADLFVSTWALNESTPSAQRHVRERDWFGARSLLLAMHHGDPLEPAVLDAGARPHALGDWMPGQHLFMR